MQDFFIHKSERTKNKKENGKKKKKSKMLQARFKLMLYM